MPRPPLPAAPSSRPAAWRLTLQLLLLALLSSLLAVLLMPDLLRLPLGQLLAWRTQCAAVVSGPIDLEIAPWRLSVGQIQIGDATDGHAAPIRVEGLAITLAAAPWIMPWRVDSIEADTLDVSVIDPNGPGSNLACLGGGVGAGARGLTDWFNSQLRVARVLLRWVGAPQSPPLQATLHGIELAPGRLHLKADSLSASVLNEVSGSRLQVSAQQIEGLLSDGRLSMGRISADHFKGDQEQHWSVDGLNADLASRQVALLGVEGQWQQPGARPASGRAPSATIRLPDALPLTGEFGAQMARLPVAMHAWCGERPLRLPVSWLVPGAIEMGHADHCRSGHAAKPMPLAAAR